MGYGHLETWIEVSLHGHHLIDFDIAMMTFWKIRYKRIWRVLGVQVLKLTVLVLKICRTCTSYPHTEYLWYGRFHPQASLRTA